MGLVKKKKQLFSELRKKAGHKLQKIDKVRDEIFHTESTPIDYRNHLIKMRTDKKESIGRFTPWTWMLEPVKGCNRSCGYCGVRLFEKGKFEFMSDETIDAMLDLIAEVSPNSRIDFAQAGEPTLHPKILEILQKIRIKVPGCHVVLYTNGATLMNGKYTYEDFFNAGANTVFSDMYDDEEKYLKLADESGVQYCTQSKPKEGDINVFTHRHDPRFRAIMLAEPPERWTKERLGRIKLSTWCNTLDWEAAKAYGLEPVEKPPTRRCDQPSKYVVTTVNGDYVLCCAEGMRRENAGKLGNVKDGVKGFFNFWFGKYMQETRHHLHRKDRTKNKYCNQCAYTSGRCDIAWWKEEFLNDSYNNKTGWKALTKEEGPTNG